MRARKVRIVVAAVGQAFGCVGTIVDLRGREVARCEHVRPYGQRANAYEDAEGLCAARGFEVVS